MEPPAGPGARSDGSGLDSIQFGEDIRKHKPKQQINPKQKNEVAQANVKTKRSLKNQDTRGFSSTTKTQKGVPL
uniref:Uncharacterized protein n=1 Tax=Rhizophora mucronata TaxID=61149 RepID=A0A2P2IXQ4_RHIMU